MNKLEYQKYLKSTHWKKFKREFFKRFEKVCRKCNSKDRIQLHHISYENLWCEQFLDVIPLCENCHAIRHNKKPKKKRKHKVNTEYYTLKKKMKKKKMAVIELHSKYCSRPPAEYLPSV